jgi:predicted aspartyl protease
MAPSCWTVLSIVSLLIAPISASVGACKFNSTELRVTMSDLHPIIKARINGAEVGLIVDSGAFYSFLSPSTASQLKLVLSRPPGKLVLTGAGGHKADVWWTSVQDLRLDQGSYKNAGFLVAPMVDRGGLLGQNILDAGDAEFDLGNGVIRLGRSDGCEGLPLAYWVSAGRTYSVTPIQSPDAAGAQTIGTALLNGVKISVGFDTGSATSLVSLTAARRAGVTPQSRGVVYAGYGVGSGRYRFRTWIAPFASFKIGDEEVPAPRIRMGDIGAPIDMVLGADFFLSHRIYVANGRRMIYFTYNGGPVFSVFSKAARDSPNEQH